MIYLIKLRICAKEILHIDRVDFDMVIHAVILVSLLETTSLQHDKRLARVNQSLILIG